MSMGEETYSNILYWVSILSSSQFVLLIYLCINVFIYLFLVRPSTRYSGITIFRHKSAQICNFNKSVLDLIGNICFRARCQMLWRIEDLQLILYIWNEAGNIRLHGVGKVKHGLHYRIVNKITHFLGVVADYFNVSTVTSQLSRWNPVIEKGH